jgi:hypothetical protein
LPDPPVNLYTKELTMPVSFLTVAQQQQYGRYSADPSAAQLARFFHLDDRDHDLVARRRGDHTRLGFALQLCTVRFLGTFLADPTDVPPPVIRTLAVQLGITDLGGLTQYRTSEIRWDHTREIRQQYGYRDFTDQPDHFRLVRWLYTRAWLSAERPTVLFDLTTARLVELKILLPGVTVLERLIARVRDRTAARLWRLLAHAPTSDQRTRLEHLLTVPPDGRVSLLDQLRRAPTRISAPAFVAALERLSTIRSLDVGAVRLPPVPPGRVKALARYAASAWAPTIARMPDERRIATLVAFASIFEASAQDDALDLLDQLIHELLVRAKQTGQQRRLRTLHDLDVAALRLHEVGAVLLDPTCPDAEVRAVTFQRVSPEQLAAAMAQVVALARPSDDHYYEELPDRYGHVRRFLPALLRTITFRGAKAGQPVLDALAFLARLEEPKPPKLHTAPTAVVTGAWRRLVLELGEVVDRRYYTFCVLERLQDALQRRDVYVSPSERWQDPRAKLLHGRRGKPRAPRSRAYSIGALNRRSSSPSSRRSSTSPMGGRREGSRRMRACGLNVRMGTSTPC